MYFNDFIRSYMIHYDLFINNISDALNKLQKNILYDIVSYIETIELNNGEKIQLHKYDYITDFENIDDIYFIIDDIEYPIEKDTLLFLSLSPLKPIYLIYKGDDSTILKYRRYCIKQNILDSIIYKTIICNKIKYCYGEAMISDICTESCKLIK